MQRSVSRVAPGVLATFLLFPLLPQPGGGPSSPGTVFGPGTVTGARPPVVAAYDVVLLGGQIVDGTGAPWFRGDLAVRGDRIARLAPEGALVDAPARTRIDASGLVVAPGFIDIQSHSRGAFLDGDGRVVSKATQGVTTEILGEGWTNAPSNERTRAARGLADSEEGESRHDFSGPHGFGAWLEAMRANGTSPNVGSFLGATTVRVYAMGEATGAPSPAQLDTMRAVMERAMRDGAFGLASALIYPPGNFASTEELTAVAEAMAPHGGIYITHMRSEADRLLEAVDEAMAIGEGAGVPVEIYHLKAAGKRNWPKAERAVAKIDSARASGLDVQADMYPYTAGSTGLTAVLPPSASAGGELLERLADLEARAAIRREVLEPSGDWENLGALAGPENVLVVDLQKEENERWEGMRLSEIADAMGVDWVEAAMRLVLADSSRVGTVYFLMSEENVRLQMRQPWIKWGTDAGGMHPDSAEGLTHPRAYGTYPRILGRYVREEGVLRLEEAVRKASSAVATRLGIRGRGILREGMYADVVVFDPATIMDRATYTEPHRLSTGVVHVLVNGTPVVRDGEHTGATPGRIVRGPGWTGAGR